MAADSRQRAFGSSGDLLPQRSEMEFERRLSAQSGQLRPTAWQCHEGSFRRA
jgi:hypothetical protein